jgi:hypothetical protein
MKAFTFIVAIALVLVLASATEKTATYTAFEAWWGNFDNAATLIGVYWSCLSYGAVTAFWANDGGS